MAGSATGGKGGVAGMPARTSGLPAQGAYAPVAPQGGAASYQNPAWARQAAAPVAPQGGFNVNQAAAGALQGALQGTQAGLGFQTPQIRPATVAGANLGAYTNPYESQVVGQSLSDLERARQMQQNVGGAQASAAGAFGGSRHGIAEAETNRAFAQQAANTAAQLRQSGFSQAQQLAGQDVGRVNAAQQQNIANLMAAQGLRQGAAAQLGALGQQAFGTGQAIQQQQMQQGLMQQGLQQALIDAAKAQYAGYTGAPAASLQAPLAALGVAPVPQSQTQQRNAGLLDYATIWAGMPR